jgi:2-isopropylmalate synthase
MRDLLLDEIAEDDDIPELMLVSIIDELRHFFRLEGLEMAPGRSKPRPMATHANTAALIYDWNEKERTGPLLRRAPRFVDESIRDGIQSPSVRDPSIEQKMALVRLMDRMGIQTVNLGLPGAGKRAQDDVERLLRFIVEEKLRITANCAARTVASDITPIIDISQKVGVPIEVMTFIGSSPIRASRRAGTTTASRSTRSTRSSSGSTTACRSGSSPRTRRARTRRRSTRCSARRSTRARRGWCCATRAGTRRPTGCATCSTSRRALLRSMDMEDQIELDWHGHNDRGLALALGLYAFEWGFDRVHGCGLGIGERVGNCSMDLLLLNLYQLGQLDAKRHDLSCLVEYVEAVSEYTGVPIHPSYPLAGRDAFRTATGVHAAAIIKAEKTGDHELADRVYSSVPARVFGRSRRSRSATTAAAPT